MLTTADATVWPSWTSDVNTGPIFVFERPDEMYNKEFPNDYKGTRVERFISGPTQISGRKANVDKEQLNRYS